MNKQNANEDLYKLAHSFNKLLKLSESSSPSITRTIENAAGRGLGIPDFKSCLKNYNEGLDTKIQKLRISLQKNFWGTTSVISLYFIPIDGTAAVLAEPLKNLSNQLTQGINQYFGKYPETINDTPSGIYVAEFLIL